MSHNNLNAAQMRRALARLDEILDESVTLIVGGGGSMILAHSFPLATSDIDAIPKGVDFIKLDPLVKQIGQELNLPSDWLNPWYGTFTHVLPSDYVKRLILVLRGKYLEVLALGAIDMLIMKCFAHRQKDVGHAKALIKAGADVDFVQKHIEKLHEKRIPEASKALDFLDDVRDQL